MKTNRMTLAEYRKLKRSKKTAAETPRHKTWSEPEKRYFYGVLGGRGEYEPEKIRITPEYAEKHVYTPDFRTTLTFRDHIKVYHEVKGSYRLKSQDSARIRFIMASVIRDGYFVWAKERRNRRWDIEVYAGGLPWASAKDVLGFHFNEEEEVVWHRKQK